MKRNKGRNKSDKQLGERYLATIIDRLSLEHHSLAEIYLAELGRENLHIK